MGFMFGSRLPVFEATLGSGTDGSKPALPLVAFDIEGIPKMPPHSQRS
jgi:hypothetical protein